MHRYRPHPLRRSVLLPVAIAAAVLAGFALRNFGLFQLTLAMIYAIAIVGLVLLTGINGQFSLGHSSFFALGAYVTAILTEHAGVAWFAAIPLAACVTAFAGFLFGLTAARLDGIYLAMATFALAVATPPLLKLGAIERWTGGSQGLVVTRPATPFGLPFSADQWLYAVTVCLLVGSFVCAQNIIEGRSGRAMMAIRDNPVAAQAMGVNVPRYRAMTFALSALFTGCAGGLAALVIGFVAPDSFTFTFAIALFVGLVVGGAQSIPGSLVGGLFILFVPNVADSISKGLSGAVYGAILIVLIYLMPSGAAGLGRAIVERLWRKT